MNTEMLLSKGQRPIAVRSVQYLTEWTVTGLYLTLNIV